MGRVVEFFKKYFRHGQYIQTDDKERKRSNGWFARTFPKFYDKFVFHRPNWVAVGGPILLGWLIYLLAFMIPEPSRWQLWVSSYTSPEGQVTPYWAMSITMLFGSMIAGATSEGGASVAFPVMTLLFGISPAIARDFSLMIQSFGMTASALTILYKRLKIEWNALKYATTGAIVGTCLGLSLVAPNIPPPFAKMYFVSVWLSFAISLFWLNRIHGRQVFLKVPLFNWWKGAVLFLFGFIGGVLTSFAGSGVDICTFACLTLLFRVNEKTATPTSVILMAVNSIVGVFYKSTIYWGFPCTARGMEPVAFNFLIVCVPIVVVGAPLGALVSSYLHRLVLAAFVYITDTTQFVAAFIIVPQTVILATTSVVVVLLGGALWTSITFIGGRLQKHVNSQLSEEEVAAISADHSTWNLHHHGHSTDEGGDIELGRRDSSSSDEG